MSNVDDLAPEPLSGAPKSRDQLSSPVSSMQSFAHQVGGHGVDNKKDGLIISEAFPDIVQKPLPNEPKGLSEILFYHDLMYSTNSSWQACECETAGLGNACACGPWSILSLYAAMARKEPTDSADVLSEHCLYCHAIDNHSPKTHPQRSSQSPDNFPSFSISDLPRVAYLAPHAQLCPTHALSLPLLAKDPTCPPSIHTTPTSPSPRMAPISASSVSAAVPSSPSLGSLTRPMPSPSSSMPLCTSSSATSFPSPRSSPLLATPPSLPSSCSALAASTIPSPTSPTRRLPSRTRLHHTNALHAPATPSTHVMTASTSTYTSTSLASLPSAAPSTLPSPYTPAPTGAIASNPTSTVLMTDIPPPAHVTAVHTAITLTSTTSATMCTDSTQASRMETGSGEAVTVGMATGEAVSVEMKAVYEDASITAAETANAHVGTAKAGVNRGEIDVVNADVASGMTDRALVGDASSVTVTTTPITGSTVMLSTTAVTPSRHVSNAASNLPPPLPPHTFPLHPSHHPLLSQRYYAALAHLSPFLARCHGLLHRHAPISNARKCYLLLSDATVGLRWPCVADIKLGQRTWDVHASARKIGTEARKCPQQAALGFRVVGVKTRAHMAEHHVCTGQGADALVTDGVTVGVVDGSADISNDYNTPENATVNTSKEKFQEPLSKKHRSKKNPHGKKDIPGEKPGKSDKSGNPPFFTCAGGYHMWGKQWGRMLQAPEAVMAALGDIFGRVPYEEESVPCGEGDGDGEEVRWKGVVCGEQDREDVRGERGGNNGANNEGCPTHAHVPRRLYERDSPELRRILYGIPESVVEIWTCMVTVLDAAAQITALLRCLWYHPTHMLFSSSLLFVRDGHPTSRRQLRYRLTCPLHGDRYQRLLRAVHLGDAASVEAASIYDAKWPDRPLRNSLADIPDSKPFPRCQCTSAVRVLMVDFAHAYPTASAAALLRLRGPSQQAAYYSAARQHANAVVHAVAAPVDSNSNLASPRGTSNSTETCTKLLAPPGNDRNTSIVACGRAVDSVTVCTDAVRHVGEPTPHSTDIESAMAVTATSLVQHACTHDISPAAAHTHVYSEVSLTEVPQRDFEIAASNSAVRTTLEPCLDCQLSSPLSLPVSLPALHDGVPPHTPWRVPHACPRHRHQIAQRWALAAHQEATDDLLFSVTKPDELDLLPGVDCSQPLITQHIAPYVPSCSHSESIRVECPLNDASPLCGKTTEKGQPLEMPPLSLSPSQPFPMSVCPLYTTTGWEPDHGYTNGLKTLLCYLRAFVRHMPRMYHNGK